MAPLVSVIIPVFNRSHLLGATLDSVLAQTYREWECIIVDDGSDDYLEELMEYYCNQDQRIFFYQRPKNRKKGANACRNYGFEVSKGKYIQWFDSDDLMHPEALGSKLEALQKTEVDYVISLSVNFRDPDKVNIISKNEKYYQFPKYQLTNYNYVTQRVNWLTYDFMGKKNFLVGIKYNENLSSSQEYNFFCKVTCISIKGLIIDKYLTYRRIHRNTIRGSFDKFPEQVRKKELKIIAFETWKDITQYRPDKEVEVFFVQKLIDINGKRNPEVVFLGKIISFLLLNKRFSTAFYFLLYEFTYMFTGRGYFIRKKLINSI